MEMRLKQTRDIERISTKNGILPSHKTVKYTDSHEKNRVVILKTDYQVAPKLRFRTSMQWSDFSEKLMVNELLQYDFDALSHFYIAFNEMRSTVLPEESPLRERIGVLKTNYAYAF